MVKEINSGEFEADALALKIECSSGKRKIAFAAINQKDSIFELYKLPTVADDGVGFNTNLHISEAVLNLIHGDLNKALLYLVIVLSFTRNLIKNKIEIEFQTAILEIVEAEFSNIMDIFEEASANRGSITTSDDHFFYIRNDGSSVNLSGFGELLSKKIYSKYLSEKGFILEEIRDHYCRQLYSVSLETQN